MFEREDRPGSRPHVGRFRRGSPLVGALLALGLAGCGGGDQERVPLEALSGGEVPGLPAELQARMDSGNAAYRMRDYEGALGHFREVVRLEPELAAGWYGIGMTEAARGNAAAADSAMARVHRLAPEIPLEHPTTQAPPNPHPAPSPPGPDVPPGPGAGAG
jgi:tetratricopeptide (TPR) repeat protein